jgi:hypothetical protein
MSELVTKPIAAAGGFREELNPRYARLQIMNTQSAAAKAAPKTQKSY